MSGRFAGGDQPALKQARRTSEFPESVAVEKLTNLIKQYAEGIKTRLYFEGQQAQTVYVGGPLNGQSYYKLAWPNHPICHHVKRGEWLVYMVKNYEDPRAWFVGKTTSKKKAKTLKFQNNQSKGGDLMH